MTFQTSFAGFEKLSNFKYVVGMQSVPLFKVWLYSQVKMALVMSASAAIVFCNATSLAIIFQRSANELNCSSNGWNMSSSLNKYLSDASFNESMPKYEVMHNAD